MARVAATSKPMKRMLVALSILFTEMTLCPTPTDAAVVIGTTVIRIGTPVIEGVDVGTTVNLFRAPVPYAQGREISTAVLRSWAGRLVRLGRRISKSTGFSLHRT